MVINLLKLYKVNKDIKIIHLVASFFKSNITLIPAKLYKKWSTAMSSFSSKLCQRWKLALAHLPSQVSNLPGQVEIVNFLVTFSKSLTHMVSAVKI